MRATTRIVSMKIWDEADDNELILGYLYCSYHHGHSTKTLIESFIQPLSRAPIIIARKRKPSSLLLWKIKSDNSTWAAWFTCSVAFIPEDPRLYWRWIGKLPEQKHREQSEQIASEIGNGLADAYTQLRELLTTFRLSIKEGNFGDASSTMLEQLSERTDAKTINPSICHRLSLMRTVSSLASIDSRSNNKRNKTRQCRLDRCMLYRWRWWSISRDQR